MYVRRPGRLIKLSSEAAQNAVDHGSGGPKRRRVLSFVDASMPYRGKMPINRTDTARIDTANIRPDY